MKPGTPLPWEIVHTAHATGRRRSIVGDRRVPVATVDASSVSGRADANAAYIVTACNAYPDLLSTLREARTALEFYADPETYHACGFMFDRPTGGFDEDFDEDHGHDDYDRPMPGKRARAQVAKLDSLLSEQVPE